jgi:hypothetical protein
VRVLDYRDANAIGGARMNLRNVCGVVLMSAAVLLTGCPKARQETNAGNKAEALSDYDTALDYYNKALQASQIIPNID